MKIAISLVYTVIVLSGIILIPNAFAENVPDWVKNNAGWWADGQIDDSSFVLGMQWLISNGIIKISEECVFEDKEYTHLSSEDRKRLCDDFNFNFVTERIHTSKVTATYNSEGFRGPEFLKEKPDKTYRIFVTVSYTHLRAHET